MKEKRTRALWWQCLESITYGGSKSSMKEDYTDIIQQVSQAVFEAIKDREENLSTQVKELDGELAKLLRLVGREVMSRRALPRASYADAGSLVKVSQ